MHTGNKLYANFQLKLIINPFTKAHIYTTLIVSQKIVYLIEAIDLYWSNILTGLPCHI
jgi:hypothetical protein